MAGTAAEILQSYVIKLGYHVDVNSFGRFMRGTSAAERKIAHTATKTAAIDKKIAEHKSKIFAIEKDLLTARYAKTIKQLNADKAGHKLDIQAHRQDKAALLAEERRLLGQEQAALATGEAVMGIATALAAVTAATVTAELKFADYMRKVYTQSELAGVSLGGLGGLGLISKAMGTDEKTLANMIQQEVLFLKGNPGYKSQFEHITGIDINKNANENMLYGTVRAIQALQPGSEAQQLQLAEQFRMDPSTFLLLKNNPQWEALIEKYKKMQDDAGLGGRKEEDIVRGISGEKDLIVAQAELVGRSLGVAFGDPLLKVMKMFDEWLEGLPNKIKSASEDNKTKTIIDYAGKSFESLWNLSDNVLFDFSGNYTKGKQFLGGLIQKGKEGGHFDMDSSGETFWKPLNNYMDTMKKGAEDFADGPKTKDIIGSLFYLESMGYSDFMRDMGSAQNSYLGLDNSMTPLGSSMSNSSVTFNVTQNISGSNAKDIASESSNQLRDFSDSKRISINSGNPFGGSK